MKRLLVGTLLVSSLAWGQNTTSYNGLLGQDQIASNNSNTASVSAGNTNLTGADNGGYITGNTNVSVGGTINNTTTNTPSEQNIHYKTNQASPVYLPNLTTGGIDTCLGSAAGGIALPGIGVAGGSTIVDENCVMIKRVKLLESLGLGDAAVAVMLQDPKMREAMLIAYPKMARLAPKDYQPTEAINEKIEGK